MGLITPLVCQTCHATMSPDSIIRIEFPIGLDDRDYVEACPCCGDVGATFRPEDLCRCIDCGGDRKEHDASCPTMREMHGE